MPVLTSFKNTMGKIDNISPILKFNIYQNRTWIHLNIKSRYQGFTMFCLNVYRPESFVLAAHPWLRQV